MSTVFLNIGQCGVQIGQSFWSQVSHYDTKDCQHTMWVQGLQNVPRAVFVDGESKVLHKFHSKIKREKLKLNIANSCLHSRAGCGSNWAYGKNKLCKNTVNRALPSFHNSGYTNCMDLDKNSSMMEVCSEMIRLKIESCDSFSGFCATHSLAGGTGSGFGSCLAEHLHDSYPTAFKMWNVVLPFSCGESPCQNYNQLLSLSHLQQYADAIVVFDNEQLTDELFRKKDKVSMEDMNKRIANMLLGCFLPVSTLKTDTGLVSIGNEPWELIRSVAPVPSLKLLQMRQTVDSNRKNYATDSMVWDNLVQKMSTQAKRDTWVDDVLHPSLGCVCVCRSFSGPSEKVVKKLKASFSFVKWNPFPVDVWADPVSHTSFRSGLLSRRSITTCTNTSFVANHNVHSVLRKARRMYEAKAYLHWYEKYDVGSCEFENAFNVLENVVLDYQDAVR